MNTPLGLIFDTIIILASGCAAFYCWMLNKRLRMLKDTSQGIGAIIKDMAISVTRAQEALKDIKSQTQESRDQLQQVILSAEETAIRLQGMLGELQKQKVLTEEAYNQHRMYIENKTTVASTQDNVEKKNLESGSPAQSNKTEDNRTAKFDYYRKRIEEITKSRVSHTNTDTVIPVSKDASKKPDISSIVSDRTFTRLVNRFEA